MLQKSLIRRLDLITLQLFVAVHEEGTLTRAASREAIAVSAASKRLMELEEALGISLFVRKDLQPKSTWEPLGWPCYGTGRVG